MSSKKRNQGAIKSRIKKEWEEKSTIKNSKRVPKGMRGETHDQGEKKTNNGTVHMLVHP